MSMREWRKRARLGALVESSGEESGVSSLSSEERTCEVVDGARGAGGSCAQVQSAPVHPKPSQVPGKLSVVGCAVPPVSVVPLGSVARDVEVREGAASASGSKGVSDGI